MEPIKPVVLTPDKGPVVGIGIVAHTDIVASEPAKVSDLTDNLDVPLQFYVGDLESVRTTLHQLIDEAVDALQDAQ